MSPEQEGVESLHAIGVLTRSTAHDLNNYMAAIMSFAELVLDELPAQHALRDEMEGILCVGRRAIVKTRELDQMARKLAPAGRT